MVKAAPGRASPDSLVYAGGTAAYGVVYQRYQSWEFERARVTANAGNLERARVSAIAPDLENEAAAPKVVKAAGLREGDVVGKLKVPRIGISVMVLQGIANNTLIVGAGHVPGTPLPGADGNVAIAAHRNTFFPQTGRDNGRRQHSSCNPTRNVRIRRRLDGNCRSGRHSG